MNTPPTHPPTTEPFTFLDLLLGLANEPDVARRVRFARWLLSACSKDELRVLVATLDLGRTDLANQERALLVADHALRHLGTLEDIATLFGRWCPNRETELRGVLGPMKP